MFDLTRLRLLRELARRGTMTAVAGAFGLTSSAVSQQLATLEREARVTLFERVGRRVSLTPEGERLASQAETLLQAVEALELDFRVVGERPQGELAIASFASFAKAHLIPAVIRTRERFPEVRVVIRELESPDAIEAVRAGRCHIAISFAYNLVPHIDSVDLVSQQLVDEPVFLALPKVRQADQGLIGLELLAHEDWIVGSRQTDDRLLAERACAAVGFVPRITHTVDDYDLMLRMVSAGLGVGFVPELGLRHPSAAAVAVRTPGGVSLSRRIHALTRGALVGSPLVRALMSELVSATK